MYSKSRRAVFDSNVVFTEILGTSRSAKAYREYLYRSYDEVKCAVVIHEVIRGSRKPRIYKKNNYREPDWKQLVHGLGPNSFATPQWKDWRIAGIAIHEMNHSSNYKMGKEALRKMTNDALIASICVRHKAVLVTCDNDFQKLKQCRHLMELNIVDWNILKTKIAI